MGLVTLIILPLVGVTIVGVAEDKPWNFPFLWMHPWWLQTILGLIVGVAGALGVLKLLSTKFMQPVIQRYNPLFNSLKINTVDAIFLSICAGFGEEFLFRVVLQHYWGIPLTSIFFVAIHGYLNPRIKSLAVYGILLSAYICLIGYTYEASGFLCAAIAHTIFDYILFKKLVIQQDSNHA